MPNAHADDRDCHVKQQLIRLLRCRLSVMPRDRDGEVARYDHAFERVDFRQHPFRDLDGIRALALCDGNCDRGLFRAVALTEQHILARLLRPVHNPGHVAQIHWLAGVDADDHGGDFIHIAEKTAGLDEDFPVLRRETTGARLAVRAL